MFEKGLGKFHEKQNMNKKLEKGDLVLGNVVDTDNGVVKNDIVIMRFKERCLFPTVIYGPEEDNKSSQILRSACYQDLENVDAGVVLLEPKGDLCDEVVSKARRIERKDIVHFNPVFPECPHLNLMAGAEEDVSNRILNVVRLTLQKERVDITEKDAQLIKVAVLIVKRIKKGDAEFADLDALLNDSAREKEYIDALNEEDHDLVERFHDENNSDSPVCHLVRKIASDRHLSEVFDCTKKEDILDIASAIRDGKILCLCSAQYDLEEKGSFVGHVLMQMIEDAIIDRAKEKDKKTVFLYINEIPKFFNERFEDILIQSKGYGIVTIISSPTLSISGDSVCTYVPSLCHFEIIPSFTAAIAEEFTDYLRDYSVKSVIPVSMLRNHQIYMFVRTIGLDGPHAVHAVRANFVTDTMEEAEYCRAIKENKK